ncbi:MAG: patatin-like phospholipase family protein [Campylobacteraceae bacterium]
MQTLKEISLVLSGGAARGAFHLGILQALDELGIEVKERSGSSIGAIVGAAYLSGCSPISIFEFFAQEKFKKAMKTNFLKGTLFRFDFNNPVFDELLNGYKSIEDLPKPLHVTTTNLQKGEVVYNDKGDIRTLVCASGSLYPVFSPIEYNGDMLVDGGVIDNFPILPLMDSKYKILGVNLHPNVYNKKQLRMIRIGFLAWHVARLEEKIKRCDFYLSPSELTKHNILKLKGIDKLFQFGYDEAKKIFSV